MVHLKTIFLCMKQEKIDWLDEQSYFSKYFVYKIKRLIMNVVYNVTGKLEEHLLQKYFVEFGFWNQQKTFEARMPIIVMTNNFEEVKDIVAQINDELVRRYNFKIFQNTASPQILTESEYKIKERELQSHLAGTSEDKIGNLTFNTFIGPNFDTIDLRPQKEIQFSRKLQYPIIKNGEKHPLYQVDEFLLIDIKIIVQDK